MPKPPGDTTSHNLRQPLQTLSLLQGLLARSVQDEADQRLVARLGETLAAMAAMLDTLPQIDAAPIPPQGPGIVLVVEPDPDLRDVLQRHLQQQGHVTAATQDGHAATALVLQGSIRPDLMIASDNLSSDTDGLQLVRKLRNHLGHKLPAIILTADLSTEALHRAASQGCDLLDKQPTLDELTRTIRTLLPAPPAARHAAAPPLARKAAAGACVFVIDDDAQIRSAIRSVLEADGYAAETYASGEAFLQAYRPGQNQCLLVDAYLPGMSGLDLLDRLHTAGHNLPSIMITGQSDVPMVVQAMKSGAADFIEKPVTRTDLLAGIARAIDLAQDESKLLAWRQSAMDHLSALTPRQREIMERVLAGHPSKNIAADLRISQRTVENHRASIMRKTGSASLPALARLALAADTPHRT